MQRVCIWGWYAKIYIIGLWLWRWISPSFSITSPIAQAKPPKHAYLVSFDTSLKQLPYFDYGSLPPNQRDRSKLKISFAHLIETLLEEDMTGPFASSLLQYGFGDRMTFLLDMTFENIDDLHYFDASSVKHNLSSSCKKLVVCLRHLMYHKQLWYDWTVVTPSMLDSFLKECGLPPIERKSTLISTSSNKSDMPGTIISSDNLLRDCTPFDNMSVMNISNQQEKRGFNTCILISSTSFNLPTQQQQANTVTSTSHNLPNNNDTCMINTYLSHQTGKPTEPDGEHRYDRPPDLPKVNEGTTSDGDG